MNGRPGRTVLAFATGWVLAPLLIGTAVGLAALASGLAPADEPAFDTLWKVLFIAAIVGLPVNLAILLVIVLPTWLILRGRGAGGMAFTLAGGVIGGTLGLVCLAGPWLSEEAQPVLLSLMMVAVPALVGAFCLTLMRRIAG